MMKICGPSKFIEQVLNHIKFEGVCANWWKEVVPLLVEDLCGLIVNYLQVVTTVNCDKSCTILYGP